MGLPLRGPQREVYKLTPAECWGETERELVCYTEGLVLSSVCDRTVCAWTTRLLSR